MANITKSFNFRNGVQVDDDNLLVNPSGLVGIGTTIPVQALDVRGNASVSGLVSSTDAKFINLEVTNLTTGSNNLALGVDKIIGAGVSIRAGIVTADLLSDPLGVVTYYGDGGQLNNIPTSQWVDKDAGLGFISIYNTGYVGVNTDDPRYSLQVGGNNDVNNFDKPGVGISSDGAIVATGIVTAHTFDGNSLGNIQGGIGTITQVLSTNANVTGIVTAGIGFTGDVRGNIVSGVSTFVQVRSTNVDATGVVTATQGFVGNLSGDLTGDVTGNVSGNIVGLAGTFTGDLEVDGSITGVATVISTKVTTTNSTLGISTASTFSVTNKLSVGKAIPVTDVDIFTTGDTIQTIVGSDSASLYLGQRVNTGIGESVSGIRFGSSLKTFEIINGDVGDVITTIHGGVFSGINTGGFKWVHGKSNTTLMTLDYKGNLGINKVPETALDVVGLTTLTGNTKIVGDLEITGNLTGAAAIPDLIEGSQIYNSVGMSTFYELDVLQTVKPSKIAIGTERANVAANVAIDAQRSRALFSSVGIGTTTPADTLNVIGVAKADTLQSDLLSVGNSPICAVDFSDAGKNLTGPFSGKSFMIPPKLTSTEIFNLISVPPGAMVYNTSINKMQVYNDSSWVSLH